MGSDVRQRARQGVVAVVVGAMSFGAGTLVAGPGATTAHAAERLPAFADCGQLRHWVNRAMADQMYAYGARDMPLPLPLPMAGGAAPAARAMDLAAGAEGTAAGARTKAGTDGVGSSVTGTNVQEAGVDEPDLVKTAGGLVVGVRGRQLWVASVTDHAPDLLGGLRLEEHATSLLLAGDRALVVSGPAAYRLAPMPGALVDAPVPGGGGSRLTVVDLDDPRKPSVVAEQEVDGSVLEVRQVGGTAWVVTETAPDPSARGTAILPRAKVRDDDGRTLHDGAVLSCSDVRHPRRPAGGQLLTVQPVVIGADAPFTRGDAAGVVASGGFVYASATRLYIATTEWFGTPRTQLHAFDIGSGDRARYVGSGSVPGTLLSQWSMSEQNGYLRVATTTDDGRGGSESRVVVLDEQDGALVRVGQVGGLGRNERIYAVRWLGDLAAIVTFRQTDPLYLVDLSDPTGPSVEGELKIPGYSAYLHPVGDGFLLGVGQDGTESGVLTGSKASLFDVRDPSRPREVSSLRLGEQWSAVESDSRAFTFLPDLDLALLPAAGHRASAVSIAVDDRTLRRAGDLDGGHAVQRFLPVGDDVIALADDELLDVEPRSLEVLGQTRLP